VPITRQDDIYTPLYHSWSYLSLIQDVFNVKNNTFHFKEDPKAPSQLFELCLKSDPILKDFGLKGFQDASENIDKALN